MLERLQTITFEICPECNLACKHLWCPASVRRTQKKQPLTDTKIMQTIEAAVNRGFGGRIAYHYYNEPTIDLERCTELATAIKSQFGLRSILWSNGYRAAEADRMLFDITVTKYPETENIPGCRMVDFSFDSRLEIYNMEPGRVSACYRATEIEMPIDYYGEVHLCCADWAAKTRIGNVMESDPDNVLIEYWIAATAAEMGELDVCRRCWQLKRSPVVVNSGFQVWE